MVTWKKSIRWSLWILILGLTCQLMFSCNNAPETTDNDQEEASDTSPETASSKSPEELGSDMYISYCQICHGDKGNGPMADMLKVVPADLTLISARRDGVFPEEEIFKIIDGRDELAKHGVRDMPIWGEAFVKSENISAEQVPEKINELVSYLKTIQQ